MVFCALPHSIWACCLWDKFCWTSFENTRVDFVLRTAASCYGRWTAKSSVLFWKILIAPEANCHLMGFA